MGKGVVVSLLMLFACAMAAAQTRIAVGSKRFTESYVLAEIAKKVLTGSGFEVEHKQGMGGTIILWEALKASQIALYPEYTGTISEEILKTKERLSHGQIRERLERMGIGMADELGFNNTYALVMRKTDAEKLGIEKISDLKSHTDLIVGITPEFSERQDGWRPLAARYGLAMKDVRTIEHALGYAALVGGKTSVKDAYSTDAKIAESGLVVLEDDLGFFPQYKAVFLYRLDAPQAAVDAVRELSGTLDEERMTRLNAEAERTKDYALAASLYFGEESRREAAAQAETLASKIGRWTARHLQLAGISLLLAILAGIPLGIVASRRGALGQLILGVTGVIQTVPSLALLALLVPLPFFGIGGQTAVAALFLYSLLPIVRNTATGLRDIPLPIRESAAAMGLEPGAQLRKVFLPMASGAILAGISTSAVINVGTATLAALIGAGGLGEPIISGLNLNDAPTILQGAIPAAALAILVQVLFEGLERTLIPRGLRLAQK